MVDAHYLVGCKYIIVWNSGEEDIIIVSEGETNFGNNTYNYQAPLIQMLAGKEIGYKGQFGSEQFKIKSIEYPDGFKNTNELKNISSQQIKSEIDMELKRMNASNFDPIRELVRYEDYGGNSREIYLRFCKGANIKPIFKDEFGVEGRPLYARLTADYSIWFIPKPMDHYPSPKEKKYAFSSYIDVVYIDNIIEIFLRRDMEPERTNRITFVKDNFQYQFVGVFSVEEQKYRERKFYKIANGFCVKNL